MKSKPNKYGLQITLGFLSIGTLVAPLKYTFATNNTIRFLVIMAFLITSLLICLEEFVNNVRDIGGGIK